MIFIILAFIVGLIAMFPLKKLAQKIYNETGYNGTKGLAKFLTILFGIVNIFLGFTLNIAIEKRYYNFIAITVVVFLILIALLTLVNKKAGLKDAMLLAILQNISGAIMIILLLVYRCCGGFLASNFLSILSINETIN